MAQCTAKSKQSGVQCKKDAVAGCSVCHIHGGKSLAGIASPTYKDGRYSRYMPTRMRGRYEEAQRDPALLELREEIALLDARLVDLLSRVDTGESGALWRALMTARMELIAAKRAGDLKEQGALLNHILELISQGHSDYRAWSEIAVTLEQRRKLVESERKRLVEAQQTLTVEKAMLLIGAIGGIIKAHVTNAEQLRAISHDISALVTLEAGE